MHFPCGQLQPNLFKVKCHIKDEKDRQGDMEACMMVNARFTLILAANGYHVMVETTQP